MAEIRRSKSEKLAAAVAAFGADSSHHQSNHAVNQVGMGRGEGEEENGTGLTAWGGRRREKLTGEGVGYCNGSGGIEGEERETGFPKWKPPNPDSLK